MKNWIKKLKEKNWRKLVASLIVYGILTFIAILVICFFVELIITMMCVVYESYKMAPKVYHCLISVLTILGVWMWAWIWTDKQ